MRTILQKFHIVIRFEQQDIRAPDSFQDQFCRMSQVRQYPNITRGRLQQKSHWILCIVRNRKCLDHNIADFKTPAGAEESVIYLGLQLGRDCFARRPITVNREMKLLAHPRQALNVIGVLVSYQNPRQVFRHTPNTGQAMPNLTKAESRINEQANLVRLQVRTVTTRTTAKNRQMNSHSRG